MCIDRAHDLACAALAINKAIIGIAELSLTEKAAKRHCYGALRYSKAIQTYYAAYNIMTSYMILTNQICKETRKNYDSVDPVKLNSEDESPETWEGQRKLEQDLSTLIGHSGISLIIKNEWHFCQISSKKDCRMKLLKSSPKHRI